MDLKWIEDFLSLAETGSFSRSAELRHITQPAFSKRIRALESWVGAYLVDRTSLPSNLTPAGKVFKVEAQEIMARVSSLRSLVHGKPMSYSEVVELMLPHTFSSFVFSPWLAKVEHLLDDLGCGLITASFPDQDLAHMDSNGGFLMCYHHEECPTGIDPEIFEAVTLGQETIRPIVRAVRGRKPLFEFPGRRDAPLPFLGYVQNSYMYCITKSILKRAPAYLMGHHQSDTVERLKGMVLEGCGIGFLPESAVRDELDKRYLAIAGDERWQMKLEVRLYRRRRNANPRIHGLWSKLVHTANPDSGLGMEYLSSVAGR